MGSVCYVCNGKRDKNVALHRFPGDLNVRKLWARFCKLDENKDDLSKVVICSRHFTDDDFSEPKAKMLGSSLVLKKGSVPSLGITLKKYRKYRRKILKPTTDQNTIEEIVIFCDSNSVENNSFVENDTIEDPLCEPTEKKWKSNDSFTKSTQNVDLNDTDNIEETNPHFFHPRFVGDIRPAHLTTQKDAIFCMNLAKREITKLRKSLNKEQSKNAYLLQKIEKLKYHLKNKNLID